MAAAPDQQLLHPPLPCQGQQHCCTLPPPLPPARPPRARPPAPTFCLANARRPLSSWDSSGSAWTSQGRCCRLTLLCTLMSAMPSDCSSARVARQESAAGVRGDRRARASSGSQAGDGGKGRGCRDQKGRRPDETVSSDQAGVPAVYGCHNVQEQSRPTDVRGACASSVLRPAPMLSAHTERPSTMPAPRRLSAGNLRLRMSSRVWLGTCRRRRPPRV